MTKVTLFFELHGMANSVTNPHPYVDAGGISMLGDLIHSKFCSLSSKLFAMQELGYVLKLDGLRSIQLTHTNKTSKDALQDLKDHEIYPLFNVSVEDVNA